MNLLNNFPLGGYMGKILIVDLNDNSYHVESLPEIDAEELIGGYGLGAKFLFQHQPASVDP